MSNLESVADMQSPYEASDSQSASHYARMRSRRYTKSGPRALRIGDQCTEPERTYGILSSSVPVADTASI